MKNRILKNIVVLTFIGIYCSSCSNDFLDTKPLSFTTVENFYQTADDAESALIGCYSALNAQSVQGVWRGNFNSSMTFMLSAGTDELVTRDGLTAIGYAPFGNLAVTSQTPTIEEHFFTMFVGINRCNYLLDAIEDTEMGEQRKAEIMGEAHFLRGLYYMYLAQMYGGVPVYTTGEHDENALREPLDVVYAQIISDFETAYSNLPNRADIQGRANRWSAAGFLAKVYTYLASCKTNGVGADLGFELNSFDWVDADDFYTRARDITNGIIAQSGYELVDNYDYLFRETTNQFQMEESLFSSVSSSSSIIGNYHVWVQWMVPPGNTTTMGGGYGWFRPTGEMFYKYNALDMRRAHNLSNSFSASSTTETIEGDTYYVPDPANGVTAGFYSVAKYRYVDPSSKPIDISQSMGNYPLLRYADILLLNAEALYMTGDEAGARERLTEVRTRSVSDVSQVDILDDAYYKADFLEELLDERSREFAFESQRRIDLIRFGKFYDAIMGLDENGGRWNVAVPIMQANLEPYKIWFPIPLTEIELSPIEQNPGY